jgi:hypothetical protein
LDLLLHEDQTPVLVHNADAEVHFGRAVNVRTVLKLANELHSIWRNLKFYPVSSNDQASKRGVVKLQAGRREQNRVVPAEKWSFRGFSIVGAI